MKNKLLFTAVAMALGFAFAQAWPGDWGDLVNVYAQAQVAVKKSMVKIGQTMEISDQKEFTGLKLAIKSTNGDVLIRAGKDKEIRYDASFFPSKDQAGFVLFGITFGEPSPSTLQREKYKNMVHFDNQAGILTLRSGEYWSYKAIIDIPPSTQVFIKSLSGNVYVLKRKGKVEANSNSGNINIENVENKVRATTGSGNVIVENSKGPIQAQTESGNIKILGGLGGIIAKETSGNISISGSGPNTRAQTGSGNIIFSPTALKPSQCIEAHVGSGRVKMRRAWPICDYSTLSLISDSGNIIIE